MKTFWTIVLLVSAFLLVSSSDANAYGYYYPRSHGCDPSFSFGFYGGSYYSPYIPYYNYYPHHGYYRPYYGYSRPYYGYYGGSYNYGGYGYYGRYSRYHRPYSYRSHRRYPRIQKPHFSRHNRSRVIRRR